MGSALFNRKVRKGITQRLQRDKV